MTARQRRVCWRVGVVVSCSALRRGAEEMPIYWSARSIPELRHLPKEEREWIVARATRDPPVTFRSGLLFVALLLVYLAVCGAFALTLGQATGMLAAVLQAPLWEVFLLNLARPKIRELAARMGGAGSIFPADWRCE